MGSCGGGAHAAAPAYVVALVSSTRRLAVDARESNARLDTLIALADELQEAMEAGEPGPALAARIGEMRSLTAAAIARDKALAPTYYALKEAVAEARASLLAADDDVSADAAAAACSVGTPAGGGAPPRSRM